MAFYNLAAGGDVTSNAGNMYPQRQFITGVNADATTLMRPAEHMASASYNIWRNIDFGKQKLPTNLGVRSFLESLYSAGGNIVVDDVIGVVALPHECAVQAVFWKVENPQADTSFEIIRVTDGTVLATVDASVAGSGWVTSGFTMNDGTNDVIGIKIVEWPTMSTDPVDPCGVYGPCDSLSLCLTLNAFILAPVAENFCSSSACYGQSKAPRDV